MTYKCYSLYQGAIIQIALIFIIITMSSDDPVWLFIFEIAVSFVLLAVLFLSFEFVIQDGKLTYRIHLWNLSIYRKTVLAGEITGMKFKRYGWKTKGTVIHLSKGINIRIIGFTPAGVYEQLNQFASNNHIRVIKTKDYQLLEKLC